MRWFLRASMLAAAALALAACESPVTYHPAAQQGGPGFSDAQLAANRWRVTFTGNAVTPRDVVENYLLLRAAEVTLKAGYHWFIFDTRSTEAQTTYHSDFVGWPGWRGRGWYWHSWGAEADVTSRPVTSYEAYAEIVLLTDEQAKNEPRAIGAQDVLDHIGPMAYPPAPPPPH